MTVAISRNCRDRRAGEHLEGGEASVAERREVRHVRRRVHLRRRRGCVVQTRRDAENFCRHSADRRSWRTRLGEMIKNPFIWNSIISFQIWYLNKNHLASLFSVPLFHKSQSNPTTKKEKSGAVAIGMVGLSEKSWVPIQLLVGICPSWICSLLKPSS